MSDLSLMKKTAAVITTPSATPIAIEPDRPRLDRGVWVRTGSLLRVLERGRVSFSLIYAAAGCCRNISELIGARHRPQYLSPVCNSNPQVGHSIENLRSWTTNESCILLRYTRESTRALGSVRAYERSYHMSSSTRPQPICTLWGTFGGQPEIVFLGPACSFIAATENVVEGSMVSGIDGSCRLPARSGVFTLIGHGELNETGWERMQEAHGIDESITGTSWAYWLQFDHNQNFWILTAS